MRKIKYRCQHLTCRMPCYEGELKLDEEKYNLFKSNCTEVGCLNSPSTACKIGFNQVFKILSESVGDDPVPLLKEKA